MSNLPPLRFQKTPTLPAVVGDGKLAVAIQVFGLAQQAYEQVKGWQQRRRLGQTYTIAVGEKDLLYSELHEWLLRQIPPARQRSLTAKTSYQQEWDDDGSPLGFNSVRVRYYYGGGNNASFTLDGHKVEVHLEIPEQQDAELGQRMSKLKEDRIVFSVGSQAAQRRIMVLLEDLAQQQKQPKQPKVMIANKWGQWERAKSLAYRDPATVVLAAGQMERLSGRLATFLENEQAYTRPGLPYHLGFLLSGPPGTGKSSAAMALALAHKMDVYYLPLSDIESDVDLIALFSRIPDRSLLLLEDIDVVYAARDRDDNEQETSRLKASAAGLLNALDGAVTPHGLVTVMTTNKRHLLDPALIRPGRCDVDEEIGYLTDEQLARLVAAMTGRTGPLPLLAGREVPAAEITRHVAEHVTDPDTAYAAIVAYLNQRLEEAA